MDTLTAIATRHSVAPAFLVDPAPDGDALGRILSAGASAPDHGLLRPWRFVLVRGEARHRLGEVFAAALRRREPDAPEEALAKEKERPLRAPLVVAIVAAVDRDHPKIPEVEQLFSAGAAAQNMLLAAHAQGFGAKWLTGANAYDEHVKAALGLGPHEHLAGFIHLGTVDGTPPKVPRADAGPLTSEWRGVGT